MGTQRLIRSFGVVGLATMASRLTGFVRDVLVAAALGATVVADAYIAAFLLPNLFRRLVAEGAFNAAFVPVFARRRATGGESAAVVFAEQVLGLLLAAGLAAVVVGQLAIPVIVQGVAAGFVARPATLALAEDYLRIMLPYVAIVLLVAVVAGVLNARERHALVAWAGLILNIALIAVLGAMLFLPTEARPQPSGTGFVLAWTVLFAVLAQFAVVWLAARGVGRGLLMPRWPGRDPDVRQVFAMALPGLLIAGAGHVNVVVAAQIASVTPSAVAWLYYAERVFQLPLGFVTAAIGVVLLPAVARHLAEGDTSMARAAAGRALELGLLIILPAAAALVLLAEPIVAVLYQRGAFTPADTQGTAAMLGTLALGLPGFLLVKVLLPAFLAREHFRAPLAAAVLGIAANALVGITLGAPLGAVAAAWGVALSAWVNAGVLWVAALRLGLATLDDTAMARIPRLMLAATLTGLVIMALMALLSGPLAPSASAGARAAALAFVCALGLAAHGALAWRLQAVERDWRGLLRRGPPAA